MKKWPYVFLIVGSIISASISIALFVFVLTSSRLNKVTNTYTLDKDVVSIDSNTSISDIKFIASTDGSKKVVCYEYEKFSHSVTLSSEGLLTIRTVDTRAWYEKMGLNSEMSVEIYLPSTEYDDLKVVHTTGSVTVPGEFTFNSVDISGSTGSTHFAAFVNGESKISTSTGSIHMNEVSATNIKLHATTGGVHLDKVVATETLEIETSTGGISVKESTSKNLKVNASTGSVSFNKTEVIEHMKIETSTGNISLVDSDAATLNLKTTTGSVRGTLLSPHIFYAKSTTGTVNVPHSTEGGLCEVETTTGSINFEIKA